VRSSASVSETKPTLRCFQFLQGDEQVGDRPSPAVQPPHQHHIDFTTARGVHELLTGLSLDSTGTDFADLYHDSPAAPDNILPQRTHLHRERLLIGRGDARVQTCAQHFRLSA
jgi:hypothetical protein